MDSQPTAFENIRSIIRTSYHELVKTGPCLSSQDLSRLKIICSDLSLHDGNFSDHGPRFLSLYPRNKLHKILEETQPWLDRDLPERPDISRMCAALEISYLLSGYLRWSVDDEWKSFKPLLYRTKWETRDWQVRIVQAYVDHKTGTIRARKSPIIDMAEDTTEKTELLLSWLLADPIEVRSSKQDLVTEAQVQDYLQSGKAKKLV
ncbi:MAG: hypothetical protein M1820_008237 [Bogoriella megaspora]|nr:MAG: hypothetical protein M1820_008237 [Bogoriella megaspora]